MQSFSHLQAFVWVQALKSLLLVGGRYKAVGAYLPPRSKSRPLASSPPSAKQLRQVGYVHPISLLLLQASSYPMLLSPNDVPFSQTQPGGLDRLFGLDYLGKLYIDSCFHPYNLLSYLL